MEHTWMLESLDTYEREYHKETELAQKAMLLEVMIREDFPKYREFIRKIGRYHLGKSFD